MIKKLTKYKASVFEVAPMPMTFLHTMFLQNVDLALICQAPKNKLRSVF